MTFQAYDLLYAVYGILSFVGGLIGYLKSDSIASLIAGVAVSLLVLLGLYLKSYTDKFVFGLVLAGVGCLAMLGKMGPAYFKEGGKVFPHLVFTIYSAILIVMIIYDYGVGF